MWKKWRDGIEAEQDGEELHGSYSIDVSFGAASALFGFAAGLFASVAIIWLVRAF